MKPLQELLKGKVVNCQTEEEAKEFLQFLHKNGYKWRSGDSLLSRTYFEMHINATCYYCYTESKDVEFGHKESAKRDGYEIITYQQFKQLINENNMETKEVKIQVPEGYEIDKENSTFDCIKFKPIKKVLSYEDVAKELFKDKKGYCTDKRGIILSAKFFDNQYLDANNCTSEKQAQKLLAINKLMNVARYLNDDWQPDWDNEEKKYILYYSMCKEDFQIYYACSCIDSIVYFKSEEAAQQAIEILGEETIKTALSTDW